MTDRYAGVLVVLERDIREDAAEATLAALRQIRGVLSVQPAGASPDLAIAQARADGAWRQKILGLLDDER